MAMTYIFEVAFITLLILGVIFSMILNNIILQGITILIFGMMTSTLYKFRVAGLNYPFILLVIGFVLGYVLATKEGYKLILLILFLLGVIMGLIVKKLIKKYIETTN